MTLVFSQDLILEMNELRYRMTELEGEKLQYEKKLKSTKVSGHRKACPERFMSDIVSGPRSSLQA